MVVYKRLNFFRHPQPLKKPFVDKTRVKFSPQFGVVDLVPLKQKEDSFQENRKNTVVTIPAAWIEFMGTIEWVFLPPAVG